MPNRLDSALSPYLRQHADNPVDWWEWTDEAFAEARRRDVPVLLSVGYAACHWCHVMAHESFEDAATAEQMNADYVCIKVDREERPDVDAVHMAALVALTKQGGWPMTVFLTPDGAPFHAGTYFPPVPVRGMPSFRQVLSAVKQSWLDRRDDVERQARSLVAYLQAGAEQEGGAYAPPVALDDGAPASAAPSDQELAGAVTVLLAERDSQHGGFGDAPKFPPSMTLEHLLRHHARTGDALALATVRGTAAAMASGGLYDQLGGGFARYSVDETWTVPHFEKMLYDNAQLVGLYARLWRATGDLWARRVALETAEFMTRELLVEGGFAASLDADTEGVEGRFYVWTPEELARALASSGPDDAAWVARICSVTQTGSFEDGASVLRLHPEAFASAPPPGEEAERDDADRGARWARLRPVLHAARALRTPPGRDDKVVTSWNGLAIGSFAEAGRILDAPHLVRVAEGVATRVVDHHLRDGRLRRASVGNRLSDAGGSLEDYALLADGLLTLFAATAELRWLTTARELVDTALDLFVDGVRVHDSAAGADGPALFVRAGDPSDNASPSGRSALAGALVRLGAVTGDIRYRVAADVALAPYRALALGAPRFAGWGLSVAESLLDGPREIVIVGEGDLRELAEGPLARAAWAAHAPGTVIVVGQPDGPVPTLENRPAVGGRPTGYVCRGTTCSLPLTSPAELAAHLSSP